MRIKSLKLTGFKSFVEPVELRIETGLTGIVGPNGCGKSNLLEAIRWVMGEGSPKSMRGAGMEDVIFAGTASRPPRNFAEVTISATRDGGDTAPAFVANDDDPELEVTRRIERGAGSAYRANGCDVRAKDVALIFADAATGAHSPALVSQGRIGAIIAAKPQERRQMLEEAAGISGLHVRRKDAEQKLRAAENNLNRLDTILADMDARAGQLRRQARQAERYRKLTTQIAQAEARLIFVHWREAKAAADAAREEAETKTAAVEQTTNAQKELSARQQGAAKKLADDRAAAMIARDAAGELSRKLIELSGERDRITQRQADLNAQRTRMDDDAQREDKLTHDAADALKRLEEESAALAEQIKLVEEERPALIRAAENAERQARESEVALAKAMAEQARAEAEQRVADAALAGAVTREERGKQAIARLNEERGALGNEAKLQAAKVGAAKAVSGLQTRLATIATAMHTAEAARLDLTAQRDDAQSKSASANAELAALTSERNALERSISGDQDNRAIDHIKVATGYERALAAALGDDVNAAVGGKSGRRWTKALAALPDAPDQLADHIQGPEELALRLSMVRVVENDDGQMLAPGERLVTLDGYLRRWDGLISEDDGAATAEQLIRANRLAELAGLLPDCRKGASRARARTGRFARTNDDSAATDESAQGRKSDRRR